MKLNRKGALVLLALVAVFVLGVVPAFAQATPVPPPTFDETLEGITTLAVNFNVMIVIFIAVVIGGAAYLYRRMTKAAR